MIFHTTDVLYITTLLYHFKWQMMNVTTFNTLGYFQLTSYFNCLYK